jgi:hypothetical protein
VVSRASSKIPTIICRDDDPRPMADWWRRIVIVWDGRREPGEYVRETISQAWDRICTDVRWRARGDSLKDYELKNAIFLLYPDGWVVGHTLRGDFLGVVAKEAKCTLS